MLRMEEADLFGVAIAQHPSDFVPTMRPANQSQANELSKDVGFSWKNNSNGRSQKPTRPSSLIVLNLGTAASMTGMEIERCGLGGTRIPPQAHISSATHRQHSCKSVRGLRDRAHPRLGSLLLSNPR